MTQAMGSGRGAATGTNVLVAGTGALACVYAALLARVSGTRVTIFGHWREQLDAIEEHGITVAGPGDERETTRVDVCRDAGELAGPFDLVVVATKGYQISARVREIRHAVGRETAVFGVQNGLTPWQMLEDALDGSGRALAGESMVAGTKSGPGAVRLFSLGDTMLAPTSEDVPRAAAVRAADALNAAGLPARVVEPAELQQLLWQKAILTAGLNATSILLRVPVSGIRSSPAATRVVRRVMAEVAAVAAEQGVELDVDASYASTAAFGDNRPSGLQDFLVGRPTEVDDISGAVAACARAASLAAPANELLHDLVTALYETASVRIPEDPEAMRPWALDHQGARA
jgi:2-dehydropantoate 2-reductase